MEIATEPLLSPHLKETLQHIGGIAAAFILLELFLMHGPPVALIKRLLSTNPRLSPKEIDATVPSVTTRIIGFIHLVIQVPLALHVLESPTLQADPIYGSDDLSTAMIRISAGYFVYDAYVCSTRDEGLQYLVHGLTCLCAYAVGAYTEWLHYFGAVFLMWELSTPFVYMRWFLYKSGNDGGLLYKINGLAMIASFFLARLVFGSYQSYKFLSAAAAELASPRPGGISGAVLYPYALGCATLNCLNCLWMYKMVSAALHVTRTGKTPDMKQE